MKVIYFILSLMFVANAFAEGDTPRDIEVKVCPRTPFTINEIQFVSFKYKIDSGKLSITSEDIDGKIYGPEIFPITLDQTDWATRTVQFKSLDSDKNPITKEILISPSWSGIGSIWDHNRRFFTSTCKK